MDLMIPPRLLDCTVDHEKDHVLGPADAEIRLVEYGSYACPHCRAANEPIAQARDQLGDRVCYAFRHTPLSDNSLSFRAAELAELAQTPEAFWSAHIKLTTRSMQLTEDDLVAVATDLGVNADSLYALVIPTGPWSHGWDVPMATDTAFAIAVIAVMGARVPVRRPDCQLFGVRWCIPEPRNVGIEPHYYSAVSNLQGAQMILFPLMMTWIWFQILKTSPIPSFVSRRRGHQQR